MFVKVQVITSPGWGVTVTPPAVPVHPVPDVASDQPVGTVCEIG